MTALLSSLAPADAEAALIAHGHRVIRLPPHPCLPRPIASHPDTLLFFASDAIFCTALYEKIAKAELTEISRLTDRPIKTVSTELGDTYPRDVLLNAAAVGGFLFCRPDATAQELVCHPDFTVVPVRQGYAKCSVIPIAKKALITADVSIADAAAEHGIEALLLPPGGIQLDGYDYGFPGGCASFFPYGESDTVFFCGSLLRYGQKERMQAFCARYGVQLISLGDFMPTDVGTIFMIESKR